MENQITISDNIMLPANSYSYAGMREGIPYYSWLDNVVSSRDFHNSINNISILYNSTDEDHIPLSMHINVSVLPKLMSDTNESRSKITWDRVKESDLKKYFNLTDRQLDNINIPADVILCTNINCSNSDHTSLLEFFYCKHMYSNKTN